MIYDILSSDGDGPCWLLPVVIAAVMVIFVVVLVVMIVCMIRIEKNARRMKNRVFTPDVEFNKNILRYTPGRKKRKFKPLSRAPLAPGDVYL